MRIVEAPVNATSNSAVLGAERQPFNALHLERTETGRSFREAKGPREVALGQGAYWVEMGGIGTSRCGFRQANV